MDGMAFHSWLAHLEMNLISWYQGLYALVHLAGHCPTMCAVSFVAVAMAYAAPLALMSAVGLSSSRWVYSGNVCSSCLNYQRINVRNVKRNTLTLKMCAFLSHDLQEPWNKKKKRKAGGGWEKSTWNTGTWDTIKEHFFVCCFSAVL